MDREDKGDLEPVESTVTDKLKVIVIDDEESIRDTLKWYLEDLGCEVLVFSEPFLCDVYQGHECTQGRPCADGLIVDYQMPGMNGLEFIAKMIQHGCRGMTANMMIMSGNTFAVDMARAKELGCRVIQKPFPLDFLDSWLEELRQRK